MRTEEDTAADLAESVQRISLQASINEYGTPILKI